MLPTPSHDEDDNDLLPMPHLTATTVMGGTVPERDTVRQLLATQIASAITTRNSEESRLVVVGLGLEKADLGSEEFMDLVDAALSCL